MTERQKVDQIVGECFIKAAQIILNARTLQGNRSSPSDQPPKKCWFNLDIEDAGPAARDIEPWRRDTSAPLVLEIYLQPWGANEAAVSAAAAAGRGEYQPLAAQQRQDAGATVEGQTGSAATQHQQPALSTASTAPNPFASSAGTDAAGPSSDARHSVTEGTLLERWVIQYQHLSQEARMSLSRSQLSRLDPPAIYKRMVIMLRSLYSYVRVLPAYRMYRASKRNRGNSFSLSYRLSRGRSAEAGPGSRIGSRMQTFPFTPIETPYGSMRMGVDYAPSATVTILEQTTSAPALPQIISDYIGGGQGMAGRQPLRSSLSTSLYEGRGGTQPDPCSSPPISSGAGILRGAYSPLVRRHSWSTQTVRIVPPSPPADATLQGLTPAYSLPATAVASSPSGQLLGTAAQQEAQQAQQEQQQHLQQRLLKQHLQQQRQPQFGGSAPQHQQRGFAQSPAPHQRFSLQQPAVLQQGGFGPALGSGAGAAQQAQQPPGTPSNWMLATPPKHPGTAHSPKLRSAAGTFGSARPPPAPSAATGSTPPTHPGGISAAAAAGAMQPIPVRQYSRGVAPQPSGLSQSPDAESECCIGSIKRHTSAPVCIPGAGNNHRTLSTNDLWALARDMQQSQELPSMQCGMYKVPASAPAASHMRQPGSSSPAPRASPLGPADPVARQAAAAAPSPGHPPAPLQHQRSTGSESDCSASSFPASCSPQLPFAFTPSQHSLASLADHQVFPASYGATPLTPSPSPPISGRDISALAVIRRPSWSARSGGSSYHLDAATNLVGYSVSPVHDSLESSLLSSSTPRQFYGALPSPTSSPLTLPLTAAVSGGSFSSAYGPPRLTFPTSSDAELQQLLPDESEVDALPFAIDGDGSASPDAQRSLAAASAAQRSGGHMEVDAAVGAFVRLIQDAPPLRAATAASLAAAAGPAGSAAVRYDATADAGGAGCGSGGLGPFRTDSPSQGAASSSSSAMSGMSSAVNVSQGRSLASGLGAAGGPGSAGRVARPMTLQRGFEQLSRFKAQLVAMPATSTA